MIYSVNIYLALTRFFSIWLYLLVAYTGVCLCLCLSLSAERSSDFILDLVTRIQQSTEKNEGFNKAQFTARIQRIKGAFLTTHTHTHTNQRNSRRKKIDEKLFMKYSWWLEVNMTTSDQRVVSVHSTIDQNVTCLYFCW